MLIFINIKGAGDNMDELRFLRDLEHMSTSEFERVVHAILKHAKASDIIDGLYKKAAAKNDLPTIKCKVCKYKGKTDDVGMCPECGAVMGEKPTTEERSELDNYLYTYQMDRPDSVYEENLRGRLDEY